MTVKRFLKKHFPKTMARSEDAKSVLIVDDDEGLCDNLMDILDAEGYETFYATTTREAAKLAREIEPWVALVDIKLPDGSGTALLSDFKLIKPDCVCILMTAHADVDTAVVALEKGAFYYLRKPVQPDDLIELVELAFETIRVKKEKAEAEDALRDRNRELEEALAKYKHEAEK